MCDLKTYWTVRTGWREGRTCLNVLTSSELEAFLMAKDSLRVQSSWNVKSSWETAFCKVTFWELGGLRFAGIL